MSKLNALASNPRRTLGTLAVVLAAVGITVGSGANFTASSANAGNSFTTGKLMIANGQNGAVLRTTKLTPGQSDNGWVDISNTGDIDGKFALSTANASDSNPSLLGQLQLSIIDCGVYPTSGTTPDCTNKPAVYTGKVNGVGSIDLGQWAPNDKHHFEFTVTLPSSTDNSYQGKNATIDFNWSAVSN